MGPELFTSLVRVAGGGLPISGVGQGLFFTDPYIVSCHTSVSCEPNTIQDTHRVRNYILQALNTLHSSNQARTDSANCNSNCHHLKNAKEDEVKK